MTWTGANGLADLAVIATRQAFGQDVTYTPAGGSAEAITAIFDPAYEIALDAFDPSMSSGMVAPVVDVRWADVSQTIAEGDTFTIAGVTYEAVEEIPGTQERSSKWRLVEV